MSISGNMPRSTIVVFGAAEKGQLCTPLPIGSLEELLDSLGHPPEHSEGLICAIQILLYQHQLIYFRVEEEGFSTDDYIRGLKLLKQHPLQTGITAIGMPGVGERELIHAATPICHFYHSILLVSEKDLYDYLTSQK